jgi:outer membrane lipoprotein-sorting protein
MESRFIIHSTPRLASFAAPSSYAAIVREPTQLAGSFMVSKPGSLQLYDSQTHIAVDYRNLPKLSQSPSELISAAFEQNLKLYNFSLGGSSKVARLPVIELRFKPKVKSIVVESGRSQIYDEYSFPLKVELATSAGDYSSTFTDIHFNDSAAAPVAKIPGDAIVSDWDYNSKSYELKDAQKEALKAGFHFDPPKTNLVLIKIIRQKGPIAAFTAFYADRTHLLTVMAFKNYEIPHTARGLNISGGRLNLNPHMSTFTFTRADTNYILSSNLPVDELVSLK